MVEIKDQTVHSNLLSINFINYSYCYGKFRQSSHFKKNYENIFSCLKVTNLKSSSSFFFKSVSLGFKILNTEEELKRLLCKNCKKILIYGKSTALNKPRRIKRFY
ncbi:hypothetical protein BpHYR1_034320 [Brachionus plicatilis]|uniref:Uncharacterized protein n=1 Tax=Brachionus plicatilis TaxID=10195 RepID=A0A3M7RV38_BRAPC|nr:hypothetical protein BpHYR1_034320 [Brachionus plicatilis]